MGWVLGCYFRDRLSQIGPHLYVQEMLNFRRAPLTFPSFSVAVNFVPDDSTNALSRIKLVGKY